MKKLMIALAAAATTMLSFGAGDGSGQYYTQGTSFDAAGYTVGEKFDATLADDGETAGGNRYWYTADADADNIISNYEGEASAAIPALPTDVSRPDVFATESNSKYLRIDTNSKLYRTVTNNGGSADFVTNETYGVSVATNIFLDTLVKFTAADSAFVDGALEDGDKIAIEYVEHEAEGDDVGYTNFVVRAGYIGAENQISQTNYIVAVPAGFNKEDWHRLTVRTFAAIDESKHVGFVVYLDENPLQYSTSDACADNITVTGLAAEFYTSELHALFPSAVDSQATGGSVITAAAFQGNGCIDDVVFTTKKPDFIEVNPDVIVEWDEHVATLTLNDAPVDGFVAGTQGSTNITPKAGGVVTVVATFSDGYVYGACDTDGNGEWDASTKQFTNLTPGETCSIVSMLPLFKVGDEYFDNFDDALYAAVVTGTAQTPATLQLMADCDSLLTFSEGNIILDLAGFDIQGGTDADYSLINAGANLIITNSGAEASIKMPLGESSIAMYQDAAGFTTVEAGTFEGIILFNVDYEETFPQTFMLLKGGKFIDPDYATESTFYLADCVQSGLTATYDSETGYVQIGGETPQPTPFALTTTGGANAEIVTDPANVSALTEETEVTITATAAQDYTYDGVDLGTDWTYDSQADAISMTTNVSENTTVVVPDAVSEQSQEDWPEGQDLIDAEGKAAGDLFNGITNALATADAKAVATWAEANNVAYADKGSILPEAFLLNCANTQAAIDEAAANFKVTAITVVGDTVTITPADGADYGNGKVVIEGTATLSPISWHEKTDGDHFFRATLVVKPVAAP